MPAILPGLALASGLSVGADRLVVVHDAGGTVPAAPWIERTDVPRQRTVEAAAVAAERLARSRVPASPDALVRFPVEPAPLRAGRAERVRVRALAGTLFAIGSDESSARWLEANARELRGRGATGLLVAAESVGDLRRMREIAARHGLSLDPMPGAALAEAFGARSYPFVAEPSE